MKDIRLKDIPSFIRTTDSNDIMLNFLGEEAQNCLNASSIVINTFDAFEQEVLEVIRCKFPNIYTVGPLSLLSRQIPETQFKAFRTSLWKEESSCFDWLDKWGPNSVVYVNYGSITFMSEEHFKEFAWGLANSNCPFLWIVRPDVVIGDSTNLPEEFFIKTKDRGFLTSWCAQDQVLSHLSIGAFLTHCGWNSSLEAICGGVPVICWPFFAEQQTNCRYACTSWGIGVEVNHDVKREEVTRLVEEMIRGDKGKELRKRASEWKKKAEEATDFGGSSYDNFSKFIKEALHYKE